MFTSIHQLSQFDQSRAERYRDRWESPEGRTLADDLRTRIQAGGGEDFLQWDFEHGRLGFLEDDHDLRGLALFKENITFPHGDNFEGIDFSFVSWHHCTFRGACFISRFNFARLFNCEFRDCTFANNSFYGCHLERIRFINCQFVENNTFTNCDCVDLKIEKTFVSDSLFTDCRFDANTVIEPLTEKPFNFGDLSLDRRRLASIYRGIKEAYDAGGVHRTARNYFFRQMQATTRFNSDKPGQWLAGLALEHLAGYGVRPLRVLRAMVLFLGASSLALATRWGLEDGFVLGAGGFFTFGASTDLLDGAGFGWWLLYIGTAFAGVSLTALFVTVLANVWLRER